MTPIPPTICRWCGHLKEDCRCCHCGRSRIKACSRLATTTDLAGTSVCKVCYIGCAELRLVPLDGLSFQGRVVSAHEPLRMEYVP